MLTVLLAATTPVAKATAAAVKLTPQQLQQMLQNQPALQLSAADAAAAARGVAHPHVRRHLHRRGDLRSSVLLAVQTTKQEGLSGTIGGRVDSAYRGRLGFEGQIARVTGVVAVTFVVVATLVSLSGI